MKTANSTLYFFTKLLLIGLSTFIINLSKASDIDCSGTPIGGVASTNTNNACFGQSFTLTGNGISITNGLTYQWQDSMVGSLNFYDIIGANSSSFITTQNNTKWYRLKVTCVASGITSISSAVVVTTPPLFGGFIPLIKIQLQVQLIFKVLMQLTMP